MQYVIKTVSGLWGIEVVAREIREIGGEDKEILVSQHYFDKQLIDDEVIDQLRERVSDAVTKYEASKEEKSA